MKNKNIITKTQKEVADTVIFPSSLDGQIKVSGGENGILVKPITKAIHVELPVIKNGGRMKQKIYLIDWVDSMGNPGWKHTDELEIQLAMCQTVGFYVSENKEAIMLALNRDTTGENLPFGELITIPKVAIKRKRKIAVSL